ALKADIISQYQHAATVAVAGVASVSAIALEQILQRVFAKALKRIVLAFDMDWQTNQHVKAALLQMKYGLEATGLPVAVRTWDEKLGKGYDDALMSVERIAA
ncbi:MAG TPA: DUF3854 domain-containing protein, partial [Pyrinomonadaceae bacterium]|nr:DUF3854 domain-containing protein [Pyrinomonadaceae bacterium]